VLTPTDGIEWPPTTRFGGLQFRMPIESALGSESVEIWQRLAYSEVWVVGTLQLDILMIALATNDLRC
jgi:hypothetical protein